jgi:hypothetical protein
MWEALGIMPTKTVKICDYCDEVIYDGEYLIYDIFFWNNSIHESQRVDFLKDNNEAAMFCSMNCMGKRLGQLMYDEGIE